MLPPVPNSPTFSVRGPIHRSSRSNSGGAGASTLVPITFASPNNQQRVQARASKYKRELREQWMLLVVVVICLIIFIGVQVSDFQRFGKHIGEVTRDGVSDRRMLRTQITMQPEPRHPFPNLKNLVIVACHAVFVGFDYTKPENPKHWFLLDYQQYPKYSESFINHIQIGVVEAAADPAALLLFSGGQTRKAAGPRSEGESYWLVAEAAGWYGRTEVRERAFTEEHARDSFENLLFSICRFYELTGQPPAAVTVIGYDFKRRRYTNLHRASVRYPLDRFNYIGTPALTPGAEKGEALTIDMFESDPYGCTGELLAKKESRDPFAVGPYANNRCPPLEAILAYCSAEIFEGPLPWDSIS